MKNRRLDGRNEKLTIMIVMLILLSVLVCSITFGSIHTQAASAETAYKYYTSIRIEPGDSLWSIASSYISADYEDMNDYIKEICEINHISQDDIHSGQYLTIPYYSSEYLR